ncbi:MAG: protein-ADP-ribose hydrolase [Blautia sp.]|nr:protein-ADP-ribose hydrolase [Blautia sp.]
MNQSERRNYLIDSLLEEKKEYKKILLPQSAGEQKALLRSLMNVRMAAPISEVFLQIQDEYLKEETKRKGITDIRVLKPVEEGIYLWQGDITTLKCDAIVNAANSGMTGCYQPCHNCIDNCIHTYAGIQLRNACADIMEKQGHEEPTGQAKITPAFNLPCRYVLHTVGPIVQGKLTKEHEELLASCYRSCLELADENEVKSVAFCCISTGVFMFPNERAAEIAVQTVRDYRREKNSGIEVIFNVWKDEDYEIYRELLG